jgi:hypothetical protein
MIRLFAFLYLIACPRYLCLAARWNREARIPRGVRLNNFGLYPGRAVILKPIGRNCAVWQLAGSDSPEICINDAASRELVVVDLTAP